jgi:hypothetical protein
MRQAQVICIGFMLLLSSAHLPNSRSLSIVVGVPGD